MASFLLLAAGCAPDKAKETASSSSKTGASSSEVTSGASEKHTPTSVNCKILTMS